MPTRTVNNVTFHYAERGHGTPIVLVHGFPLDGRIWEAQLESLSDRYRVIAPDLRGFGQSISSEPFTIESLADDLHALLRAIGALPAIVAGLSMGGYVALAFARKYPADLRALGLIDTRAEADAPAAREARDKMIELVRTHGTRAVAEQMFPKMLAEQTLHGRQDIAHRLRRIMESQPPRTVEYALAAMRDRPDFTSDLPSIAVPTLIIVGEHDVITPPAVAEAMSKQIRNPTLVVIRRAGHLAPMEQPEDVTTAIRRFAEMATRSDGR
ncbi:alpha/beta fold hydrolase [Fontivita pretiosa]|uniref:alpha/beta fold hydrolase n=1 Tax=Fontivita pretiosa TaxID=2989684 RepID=UPI003D1673EE